MQASRTNPYLKRSAEWRPVSTEAQFVGRWRMNGAALALSDALALAASLALVGHWTGEGLSAPWLLFVVGCWLAVSWLYRLLPGWGLSAEQQLGRLFVVTLSVLGVGVAAELLAGGLEQAWTLAGGVALGFVLVTLTRPMVRALLVRAQLWGVPAVLYGATAAAARTIQALRDSASYGYQPVAVVAHGEQVRARSDQESRQAAPGTQLAGLPVYSAHEWSGHSPVAIVALPLRSTDLESLLERTFAPCAQVIVLPESVGPLFAAAGDFRSALGLTIKRPPSGTVAAGIKRALDLLLVLGSAIFWVPLCAVLALLIWRSDGGSPLYKQQRVGKGGQMFWTWKFRTMVPDAEAVLEQHLRADPELRREWETNCKLVHDPRITRVGGFLRRTSLDELPQLFNVLCGEMALVGPRPLPEYHHVQLSTDSRALRIQVRPGMTGLWQVSGRSESGNAGMERWDPHYVRHWSIWLDFTILVRTLRVVVRGSGAY